jgi:hypothetical protein
VVVVTGCLDVEITYLVSFFFRPLQRERFHFRYRVVD